MKFRLNYTPAVVSALVLAGCVDAHESEQPETVSTAKQELVVSCPFPQPAQPIVFEKEMIIRSREVVDDPCRTTWNASCPEATRGKWTFGRLMSVMSGATGAAIETSTTARTFVGRWLKFWLNNQTVGQDPNPVLARGNFRQLFLDPWLTASGCLAGSDPALCTSLDLRNAPFRLLAVVNRVDMAGFDYSTGLSGPGELRFVFGALKTANPYVMLNATVILEYKLPTTKSAQQWATQLHGLSSTSLGTLPATAPSTTSFADALQAITNLVVEPGAQPGGPNNGSSIGQIRTDENAFDSKTGVEKTWEFRQFKLNCATVPCQLAQAPVSQTPPTVANGTQLINNFLIDNQAAISNSTHVVPTSWLGGSSLSKTSVSAVVWGSPNPISSADLEYNALVRHNFGFATCNGCHYLETSNQNQNFHIGPRSATGTASISNFIGFAGSLISPNGQTPESTIQVADPDPNSVDPETGTAFMFEYNEPWRRACEIRRILTGSTLSFSTGTGHPAL